MTSDQGEDQAINADFKFNDFTMKKQKEDGLASEIESEEAVDDKSNSKKYKKPINQEKVIGFQNYTQLIMN